MLNLVIFQVRTKVARQLLKSLKSYKPKTDPQEDDENKENDGSMPPLSPGAKLRNLSYQKCYKCKLCKARFHKQSHLKCHVRLSHYKLSFVCTKCHNHFQSKQRLRHHRCPANNAEDTQEVMETMQERHEHEQEQEIHREVSPQPPREVPMHSYHPQGPIQEPLPHHGVPVGHVPDHMKYNGGDEEDGQEDERSPAPSHPNHEPMQHHSDEGAMQMMSPKGKPSPCQSNTSGGSSRSAHSSNEDQESPKVRERTSSCTPGTSPEDNDQDQMRDYRNGNMPPAVTPNLMRTPNLSYMPEVNYYMKDSPPDPNRERSFFQDRRHLPLPPIPLHRFDTAFGNPLPSIIPRQAQPPDIRAQYENGSLSNLPSPIPTTQPLQSFLGKKEGLPLLNIQKNNAFISQLIAASCIPTASSTSTTNIFTSQSTPSSGNAFETTESGSSSTTPPQDYAPPPPPPPPPIKAAHPPHSQAPSSESSSAEGGNNLNQFLDYKKYSCKICHRKFSQRSSLNRHVYTIHWNMKIKCAFCTKTYTQKCLLKQHVYEEHGVEACLQMFSANERINWKMQLVNSQKQRLNMAIEEEDSGKQMKQEASST